ncbi:alpha/beta-hydrolase [Paraphaeosphaeria sporulosa]|uniref:Carboxylic ester hydrolase n=1 Tax=Paraphaeosphaeria sporulosa TaxID=1460663 RepID=A0A177CB62_9PLEO|nr:alpha/beta-hydrolase [Paraphaeosphaeria sporulosa]OAG03950.1 alpha/beta-hydrolase [Paraphaeosphaeria sporulosa]
MQLLVGLAGWLVYLSLTSHVLSVPSPQSIRSDLTILTHNDLYGNSSTRQAATIVLSARGSKSNAETGCKALQETLWDPADLAEADFLRYLAYEKAHDDIDQYWIRSRSNTGCKAITTLGKIKTVPCNKQLPALCSQSAPLSSTSSNNTGLEWQIAVRTGDGTVIGYRDKLSFRFLGLKYGSFPSRFTYSAYQAPIGQVSALAYGPGCIQSSCTDAACSEQCLYLNIWTPHLPSNARSSKKAVMFWIHGGAFMSGFGSDTTFDGGSMASRGDVVVVTINYRLSTLGFLATSQSGSHGNYGISDMVAALDWVQKHIEDFGGDKERVTVFGQSAGGASVRALLASPRAKGKFSRAIMQSCPGGMGYSLYPSIAEAANKTNAIYAANGCAQQDEAGRLACLQKADPAKLVKGATIWNFPVVDGTYLTSSELLLDGSGPASDVALITGVMHDDGGPFTSFSKSLNASQKLTDQGYDANDILGSGLFPVPQSGNATLDIFNLTARVTTDVSFRCPTQSTVFSAVKNEVFPVVYSYEIDRGLQLTTWSPNPTTCEAPMTAEHPLGDPNLPYWKCHSGELYYEFGTAIREGRQPRDQEDVPFSQYLLDTWTAFGRTKNPNPDMKFLQARGFTNTSAVLKKTTPWKPTTVKDLRLRVLDVQPRDEGFREVKQCEVLKLPTDYYLSSDHPADENPLP